MTGAIEPKGCATGAAGLIVKRALRLPLAHKVRFVVRLAADRRVPWLKRLPLVVLLLYVAIFGHAARPHPRLHSGHRHLDDLLVAGLAVWWFARTCPPAIAVEQLDALEHMPVSAFERALPWVLGAVAFVAGVALGAYLLLRPPRANSTSRSLS